MSDDHHDVISLEDGDGGFPDTVSIFRSQEHSHLGRAYVIGTAHLSDISCVEVRELLEKVNPPRVLIELCDSRKGILTMTKEDLKPVKFDVFLKQYKASNYDSSVLLQFVLGSFTEKIGSNLDRLPGAEFREAAEYVQKRPSGRELYLIDRPIRITISRIWTSLSPWHKIKLFWHLMTDDEPSAEDIEAMKSGDLLGVLVKELKDAFPSLVTTLVHERDQYLAENIRRHLLEAQGHDVVAVVGLGHVEGMKRVWEQQVDMEALSQPIYPRPPGFPWFKVVGAATLLGLGVVAWRRWR